MADTSTPQMDPWRFMAIVAQCATESQLEIERAFRFMAALTVAMQQSKVPTTSAPPTPPRPSSTVQ